MNEAIEIVSGAFLATVFVFVVIKYRWLKPRVALGAALWIAALIYVGFAVTGVAVGNSDLSWVTFEFGGLVFYSVFAYLGIRKSAWYLAAGWGLHVLWDIYLHSGAMYIPSFYPGICIGFDAAVAVFAVYLATGLSEN